MDDRPYYYRVRGRTLGPVSLRQIRQLAQRAQIGRTTDISRDGVQWGKAGDWPEIFEAPAGVDTGSIGGLGGDMGLSIAEPATTGVASGNWYYAVGGVQQGPVDLASLQRMVAAGQVGPSDHVFSEGGADWVPVSSMPQLATLVPTIHVSPPQPASRSRGTNGLAIAGFALSLVGLPCACLCGLFSLPAAIAGLVLSSVALAGSNKSQKGLAIAGLIIGVLDIIAAIVSVIVGVAIQLESLQR